jgi:predicted metallopeptidase
MKVSYESKYAPLKIKLTVKTNSQEKIRVIAFDKNAPKKVYCNRWLPVNGVQDFYLKMPITPHTLIISVYNESNGDLPANKDHSFAITDIKALPLGNKLNVHKFTGEKSKRVKTFVEFAQDFSEMATELSASREGDVYTSTDKKYVIVYFDDIRIDGKPIKTPSRISKDTGVIEVSKAKFEKLTIPMRMAILLHEFSHFYMNENMDDEVEADLNALLIYLGLGYPKVDAVVAFTQTFANAEANKKRIDAHSQMNKVRIEKITTFIENFEKRPFMLIYQ